MTIQLCSFNFGEKTERATFRNSFEANVCVKALNDDLIKSYGFLPDTGFYYLTDSPGGKRKVYSTFFGERELISPTFEELRVFIKKSAKSIKVVDGLEIG